MGLPVKRFIAANNRNDIFYQYLQTGKYNPRPSICLLYTSLSVKQIVEAVEEPVIVVVSALGGITDKLINTSQMAANGDSAYEKEYLSLIHIF